MNEWLRIFSHPKRRAAIILIPILCLALFFYQKCDGNFENLTAEAQDYQELLETYRDSTVKEISQALSGTDLSQGNGKRLLEQVEHLTTYAKYLAQVQQQAANMQASSIFNADQNSFLFRNILKTAEDFAHCTAEGVAFGNYRAVQDWLEFSLADWGFLVAILLLVMAFQEERQKGLSAIVRSCAAGRGKLQASRLGILLCYSAAMTALLYALPLVISLCIDGGWADLHNLVQSIAEFRKCTAQLSVLGFLGQYFLMKTACGFLLGLLVWFALSFLNQVQLSWILTGGAFAIEYLLYSYIPAQSIFSPLRYVNVFSYVFTGTLYTQYVNINFLEFPVQARQLLLGLLTVLSLLLGALTVWVLTRRHPFGNKDRLGKWLHRWNRIADFFRRRLGVVGFEWYKLLLLTAGGLFLVLGILLIQNLRVNSGAYNSMDDLVYRQYVTMLQGPVTQETQDLIADAWGFIESISMGASEYEMALKQVEETIAELPDGAWLLDEVYFLNIFGPDAWRTQRQNGLYALIYLVACLSPLFACETSGDVRKVLHSTPRGRQRLFRAKYWVALGVTAVVWWVVFRQEWLAVIERLGEGYLEAPCGSIALLRGYDMTLNSWVTCLYLTKFLGLLVPMHLCLFLSERSKSFEQALILSAAILLLPAAAYSFGADGVGWLTPLRFLAEGNILLGGGVQCGIWLALSLASVYIANRHWKNH